jgi:hypothetical protein
MKLPAAASRCYPWAEDSAGPSTRASLLDDDVMTRQPTNVSPPQAGTDATDLRPPAVCPRHPASHHIRAR